MSFKYQQNVKYKPHEKSNQIQISINDQKESKHLKIVSCLENVNT